DRRELRQLGDHVGARLGIQRVLVLELGHEQLEELVLAASERAGGRRAGRGGGGRVDLHGVFSRGPGGGSSGSSWNGWLSGSRWRRSRSGARRPSRGSRSLVSSPRASPRVRIA